MRTPPPDVFVKPGYTANTSPDYFADVLTREGIVHQPHVYPFAAHVARRCNASVIVDIGCGAGDKLAALHPEFDIIGVDFGSNLEGCRVNHPDGTWLEANLETTVLALPEDAVAQAVVVCSDVIEHLVSPANLLASLRMLAERSHGLVLSTPERDLVRGADHMGPPPNVAHVREWSLDEFHELLDWAGLAPTHIGLTANNSVDLAKRTIISASHAGLRATPGTAPGGFDVLAIVTCFNEEDIIVDTVADLLGQGCAVHVIDNWSTDDSLARVESRFGSAVTTEQFPPDGATGTYDWARLLQRVDQVAAASPADWVIHHDADERRRSPWEGVSLRDAFAYVDRSGWSAVDFTVLNFRPTDESWVPGEGLERAFSHFEFGLLPGQFRQVKAWRNQRSLVRLDKSGGHDVTFPGKRVYPYNFLLKHYPIRSTAQGRRKIDIDRRARWNPDERERGWHNHYDTVSTEGSLCVDADTLLRWDGAASMRQLFTERLGRVGLEVAPTPDAAEVPPTAVSSSRAPNPSPIDDLPA